MRQQAARWSLAIAPFAFVCVGCGFDEEPLPQASHFGVLSATSSAVAHSAHASFRSNVSASCSMTPTSDGCVVARCESDEASGEPAAAGAVTIQGDATVVLDADNAWTAEGDGALFGNGDEVLFDVAAGDDVPAFRGTLRAPSSTSLTAPQASEDGAPLELAAGENLGVEWVPGNNGLMKFYASSGLVGVSCEWTISNGEALIFASTLAELPPSDGSDSLAEFWTEQNGVGREDDWEFLLLLTGEAADGTFTGYSRAE